MKDRYILVSFIMLLGFFALLFVANMTNEKRLNQDSTNDVKYESIQAYLSEKNNFYANSRSIIIGDSRMYAASQIIKDDEIIFVAKNGATCNYLWETAEKEVDKILKENPNEHFSIYINLGVNDLDYTEQGKKVDGKNICSSEDYLEYYLKLNEKWKTHNLFIISVNPVDEKLLKSGRFKNKKMTNNQKIKKFNEDLKNGIENQRIYYCDTYSTLLEEKFESTDGLHYKDSTTKKIISLTKNCGEKVKQEKKKSESIIEKFIISFSENNVRV